MSIRKFVLPLSGAVALFSSVSIGAQQSEGAAGFTACLDGNIASILTKSVCTSVNTSLDYGAGGDAQISLFVRKFPALKEHRGSVILLAGGPGESGASYLADIAFFREQFAHFDVVIPDHRGTGYSSKLCEPEETADSPGGFNLVGEEWGSCFGQLYGNTPRAHAFNMDNAAHDVAALIDHLELSGDVYLYGVSYGTELALAVAERTGAVLNGVILDSLTSSLEAEGNDLSYRSHVVDRIGQAVLARCEAVSDCPLGSNAREAYQRLLARIDSGEAIAGLDAVPNKDLRQLFGLMLDVPAARAMIPAVIHAMASGSENAGETVRTAIKTYEDFWGPILSFPQATASIPLSAIMSGSEFTTRKDLTVEQVNQEKEAFGFTSPLPAILAANRFPLYELKAPDMKNEQLPPVLLLHGTLDPKTPYDAAIERIEALRSHTSVLIVTLEDGPHGAFFTAKDCIAEPLRDFIAGRNQADMHCAPEAARLNFAADN